MQKMQLYQVSFWKYGALVSELANGTVSDLTEARSDFRLGE